MYIFKNAIRNIFRTKGRNILIGVIVFIIAFSACIGLSIRQAANNALESSIDKMDITASISVDRSAMMNKAAESGSDKGAMREMLSTVEYLSLSEMLTYAKADSVEDFTYSSSVTINGSDLFNPVTEEADDTEETEESTNSENSLFKEQPEGNSSNKPNMRWGNQGEFTLTGYNSYKMMTDFSDGIKSIVDGEIFDITSDEVECIISDEAATFNGTKVGDTITLINPNNEEETYELKVVGIYNNEQSASVSEGFVRGFSTASDASNQVYCSYNTLSNILKSSEENEVVTTDEESGTQTSTKMNEQVSGLYYFASVEDYDAFSNEAKELGLSEDYIVSSEDVNAFKESVVPLENLSEMAGYFLIVILMIGAIVLIVLNIFNIRERKYEVGVLTAIGMKKSRVAIQFVSEIFLVTILAVMIGAFAGSISSVKVTNTLLESQIEAVESENESVSESFGMDVGQMNKGFMNASPQQSTEVEYISSVKAAVDLEVLSKLMLLSVALGLVSASVSVLFIMRYEPLRILTDRD
jgi:putative ABC transport system permease protein